MAISVPSNLTLGGVLDLLVSKARGPVDISIDLQRGSLLYIPDALPPHPIQEFEAQPDDETGNEAITIREASKRFGVPYQSIYSAIKVDEMQDKQTPFHRLVSAGGSAYLGEPSRIVEWLADYRSRHPKSRWDVNPKPEWR